eukprot:gene3975-729_t
MADPHVYASGDYVRMYDETTSETLAREFLEVAGDGGRIGIISAPAAFRGIRKLLPEAIPMHQVILLCLIAIFRPLSLCPESQRKNVYLFEYDKRFGKAYPDDFVFYDYNHPSDVPQHLHGTFDYLVSDPPYINPEASAAFVSTMALLARPGGCPTMLLTGAVLRNEIAREYGWLPHVYVPTFKVIAKANSPMPFTAMLIMSPVDLGAGCEMTFSVMRKNLHLFLTGALDCLCNVTCSLSNMNEPQAYPYPVLSDTYFLVLSLIFSGPGMEVDAL